MKDMIFRTDFRLFFRVLKLNLVLYYKKECIPVGIVPAARHCPVGGLCPGGVCVQGVCVQGGLCPGWSLFMRVSVKGGLWPGGSLSRGSP